MMVWMDSIESRMEQGSWTFLIAQAHQAPIDVTVNRSENGDWDALLMSNASKYERDMLEQLLAERGVRIAWDTTS